MSLVSSDATEQEKTFLIMNERENLWKNDASFEGAFDILFHYLRDVSPCVRWKASEALSDFPKSTARLIRIYQDYYDNDVRKSVLAGRVIGRKVDRGRMEIIRPEYAKTLFGLPIAFVPCSCGHCGKINAGIPVPEFGAYKGYYGQKHFQGVFFLPVLCDYCSEEFFIAWDEDPRIP